MKDLESQSCQKQGVIDELEKRREAAKKEIK